MHLSAPKGFTFLIALMLGVLGIILFFVNFPLFGFLVLLIGMILLVLGNLIKGI